VILDVSAVPMLDMTALAALHSTVLEYRQQGIALIVSGASPSLRLKLRRAGLQRAHGRLSYARDLPQARAICEGWPGDA